MALTNRVTPDGEIIATPARGTFMGNRGGRLHRPDKTLVKRRWVNKAWITCRLAFNGRQREVMGPRSYTELFFLDEATAFAAGHRPCFECRRRDALRFAELFGGLGGKSSERARAGAIDAALHRERLAPDGRKGVFTASAGSLPRGAMVRRDGRAWLVVGDGRLLAWTPHGYSEAVDVAADTVVDVLTPASTAAVLAAGFSAEIHASAGALSD